MLQHALKRQDTWAGLIFLGIGIAALSVGREYDPGTATSMGPGYFPNLLSYLLCGLGAVIAIRGLIVEGDVVSGLAARPFLVLAAVALFAALVTSAGMVLAILALIMVGAAAGHEFRFLEVAVLAIGLAIFSVIIFQWALGLHLQLWPAW
ncbi:tripartite tricarboxylate transporter TctB family protein [Ancylobacter sp. G4_0304]|uniref:tripartite tricarboxylate transporter TctB family protein n=1 Tax=Ancylobacter sp. G4_0304 TaxID=3114289 RepID=UPI0039C739A3